MLWKRILTNLVKAKSDRAGRACCVYLRCVAVSVAADVNMGHWGRGCGPGDGGSPILQSGSGSTFAHNSCVCAAECVTQQDGKQG